MSDLDYYTGKALENDYIAQQRADANLNQQLGRLEQQRSSALQGAAINNEKLMKYLPQQLKAAGMANLGVSQSAYIRQANNYASERGSINQSFNNAQGDVMNAYADAQAQRDIARNNAITDLEKYYGEKADAETKEEQNKLENSVRNMVNNGIAGKLTKEEILAEVSGYQSMLDPVVWDEIMSAINSGEHLRLTDEEEKAAAEAEASKAQTTASVKSMVNNALNAGRTKESILEDIAEYEGQIDPVVWAEIMSAINSGEHLRLTAEEEKAAAEAEASKAQTTASVKSMVNNALNAGRTAQDILAEIAPYKDQLDPIVWAEIESAINSGEHLRLTAEEEKAAAEEKQNMTALAGSLEMRVYNGIASGYSKEQLQALIDPYKGQIEQRVWDDLQEMINADEAMDTTAAKEKATEIANDNIAFYIENGLYEDDTPEEFFLWMEAHAADADDEVFDRAMDMYRQNAADQIREENERAEAEAKSAAEKAAAEKRSNADAMISEIIGSFSGTPEELEAKLAPYLENAGELAKEYADYYVDLYRTTHEETQREEDIYDILSGRSTLKYGDMTTHITGEAISEEDAYDLVKKIEKEYGISIKSPYESKVKNGMTVVKGLQRYTYYNGEWYPSDKAK